MSQTERTSKEHTSNTPGILARVFSGQASTANDYGEVEVPATLVWEDLRVAGKDVNGNERLILNNVTGFVEPKTMLAIMGPSGCGKSTMLDTLAGRTGASLSVKGKVLLNGHKSHLAFGKSAYVTQDEMFVGTLTVRECLLFTALLRLPSHMTYAQKAQRVDEVIKELGLEGAQNTKIGNWFFKGISGGQKRRVAIGCELVTHPTLMFLDEPTSGLDAAAAFFVMQTINKLATSGRTIVTVIHQPSSEVFDLFDKLLLLSAGNVIYFGDAHRALNMFEAAGLACPKLRAPTDHFLHVINKDFKGDLEHAADTDRNVQSLLDTYAKTVQPGVMQKVAALSQPGTPYVVDTQGPNWMYQNLVLTHRFLINNWRNIGVFWVRMGMYIMISICIGTIYLDLGNTWKDTYSRTAAFFFVAAFLTFMSISGFPAFADDMAVFMRERLNGYYPISVFAVANTIASAPFIWAIGIVNSLIMYWLIGLNDEGDRFPYFFINLSVALTTVESMAMMVAAVSPHYLMGIAGQAGVLGILMLVCGFFQPVSQLPQPVWRYPLHYISFHSYAFGGFMNNEFKGTDGWGCACAEYPPGSPEYCAPDACVLSGQNILDYWTSGAGRLNKWVAVGIQCGMAIFYRFMFFGLLCCKEWWRTR